MKDNLLVGYCVESEEYECMLKFDTFSQEYNDGFECGIIFGTLQILCQKNNPFSIFLKVKRCNLKTAIRIANVFNLHVNTDDTIGGKDQYEHINVNFSKS